ncbi:hypothetical protein QQF64_006476 [Cirrhinus molitorella]|uniref:Uncharacterized protein n=1 Tax=Cirrhinus molitorella TaxID=172907 RepID=A0ABR3MF66_9TELE
MGSWLRDRPIWILGRSGFAFPEDPGGSMRSGPRMGNTGALRNVLRDTTEPNGPSFLPRPWAERVSSEMEEKLLVRGKGLQSLVSDEPQRV